MHGRTGLQPVSLCRKYVEFVGMRLDTRKMVRCLWRAMNAGSLFAGHVMTTKGVKGTRAVPSATPAISVKRVSSSSHYVVSF